MTAVDLTEDEVIDEYLTIAFANGFSKGTANVSPRDMKKLRPLLNHYRKSPHPFRACVRDNRKRFGPRTEAICAVVKDLIKGHTKWRNKRKGGVDMSTDEVASLMLSDLPDEFFEWLSEIEEEDMEQWAVLSQGDVDDEIGLSDDETMLAEVYMSGGQADEDDDGLLWKTILREGTWKMRPEPGTQKPMRKPITVIKDGKSDPETMTISMAEIAKNFKAGAVEHVQIVPHSGGVLENMGFARKVRLRKGEGGKYELQAALDFTEPDARAKAERGTIANTSAGILFGYVRKEDGKRFGAVLDHVAPTNRPWLNGLKPFGADLAEDDVEVAWFAEEGVELSRPLYALRNAADSLRSAIRLEEDQDEQSKLKDALKGVVAVLAKCEKEYGVGDDQEAPVSGASYSSDHGGGESMSDKDKQEDKQDEKIAEQAPSAAEVIQSELGLSADEVRARLKRADELEEQTRIGEIDAKVKGWEDAKKSPAMITKAKALLLADEGAVVVNLSEDGKTQGLTASAIVEQLMDSAPSVNLADDPVTEEQQAKDGRPDDDVTEENAKAELSQDVKSLATTLFLDGKARSEEDAISMAKKELGVTDGEKGK